MNTPHHDRVLRELGAALGLPDDGALARGARLKIEDFPVTFVATGAASAPRIGVYVDMGPLRGTRLTALESMMRMNFTMHAERGGVLAMHPQTRHAFYCFDYPLDDGASGQALLDLLIRGIADVGLHAEALVA